MSVSASDLPYHSMNTLMYIKNETSPITILTVPFG